MKRVINSKGEGYVTVCILAIAFSMLVSLIIYFVATVGMIKKQQEDTKRVIDSIVMEYAIEAYQSVKQGNDDFSNYDNEYITEKLCNFCSLRNEGNKLSSYSGEGKLKYSITKPKLHPDTLNLKIKTEYTITVPMYFSGIKLATAEIPTTINSYFTEKF